MKGHTRVIVVEPLAENRRELAALLGHGGAFQLIGQLDSYESAAVSLNRAPADLAIIGLDADVESAIGLLGILIRQNPNLALLPASHSKDSSLILRVLRSGAREFLALPAEPEELGAAVKRLTCGGSGPNEEGRRDCLVLAVIGASGGVGCTTLAVNLATILAGRAGHEVAIVDLDLAHGAVDVCLDLFPEQTLYDLASNVQRVDQTLLKRSLTRHGSGLFVLPAPNSLEEAAQVEPEAVEKVLELLGSLFDVVVVDVSKGLQPTDLVALERADVILLVVELEPVSLRNTARLLDLFRRHEGLSDRVRVVANRFGTGGMEVSPKKASELLGHAIDWRIGEAGKIFALTRSKGVPIQEVAAGSRTHREFLEIASGILPVRAERETKPSVLGRIAASFF